MALIPEATDYASWVNLLADPLRAKRAFWHLVLSGPAALAPATAGLAHDHPDVRRLSARVLDHLAIPDSFRSLAEALEDPDAGVRAAALHTLACDRCKQDGCRPDKAMVLGPALAHLGNDPDRYVRTMAAEIVGRFAHTEAEAAAALIRARETDPDPLVRKKASWYAPGGTIFRKTQPRPVRRSA